MSPFATAGGGFLLAVLWFDLMFDVQVWSAGAGTADRARLLGRRREEAVPETALASIAAYYARVTTAARPMNRLIAAMMLATLAALVVELTEGHRPLWAGWVSLALALAAISVAARRTVANAVRLGARRDPVGVQGALARSVLRDHLFCFAAIGAMVGLQLAAS
jgi:hypothetical protein